MSTYIQITNSLYSESGLQNAVGYIVDKGNPVYITYLLLAKISSCDIRADQLLKVFIPSADVVVGVRPYDIQTLSEKEYFVQQLKHSPVNELGAKGVMVYDDELSGYIEVISEVHRRNAD